jgi:CheY-like chemotaxis protein
MAWPAGSRFHYLYERERAVMPELLGRRRILIVEDDWMVAEDMSYMVEELGGAVVGSAGQLAQGLALAESEQLAGAILDVNLNGENTFVLADRLLANNVPVIFATGYDATMLPGRFADVPRVPKPFTALAVERAFRRIFAG